jgi:hypothetical protein
MNVGTKVSLSHDGSDILGVVIESPEPLGDERVLVRLHHGATLICPVHLLTVVGKRAASKGPTSAAH